MTAEISAAKTEHDSRRFRLAGQLLQTRYACRCGKKSQRQETVASTRDTCATQSRACATLEGATFLPYSTRRSPFYHCRSLLGFSRSLLCTRTLRLNKRSSKRSSRLA